MKDNYFHAIWKELEALSEGGLENEADIANKEKEEPKVSDRENLALDR